MNNLNKKIRWGILGPGNIAKAFAGGIAASETGVLGAIGTRNPQKPELAKDFAGARILNGYDALIADPDIDAIYIATPHPFHAQWAIACARAGKHVLCEKPMGLSAHEADAMFFAATKAKTFMAEAFMYRVHPLTKKLIQMLKSDIIGDVRMIKSSFGFDMGDFDPQARAYANDLAGGGILDVGCYPVSMARLIAGTLRNAPFAEPQSVCALGHLGRSGVDEWASALLKFPGGLLAEVSCSVSLNQDNVLRIFGSKGRLEIKDFWFAGWKNNGVERITVIPNEGEISDIEVVEGKHLYSFEVDAVGAAIAGGKQELDAPGMTWDDTLGNCLVLDQWRAAIGLTYGIEKPANKTRTLSAEHLKRNDNPMKKRQIPGLSQPTSLVALGFEFFENFADGSILLDAFYERGGNLFDTAYVYGGGKTESILGDWHTSRELARNELVIIGKGAHSPLCYPDIIAKQLDTSLDRLKTDFVDAYFMHRDNLEVPVGEFVDAVDQEVKEGRIRGPWGGSNWTMARFDEAVAYAKAHDKTEPSALSNNFSLAEMVKPIWEGCIAASSDEWKRWLKANQVPNFAWSSQGRGFFTNHAGRDKLENSELVETWYSQKNFARRDRAIQLARELGRTPIHIALAYVLAQPFPVVPLIGPRRLVELEDSLSALDIELSDKQVGWLENG